MATSSRHVVRSWLLVVAAFVVALKALDVLPALMVGTPHGLRVYATVDEAQRAVGARIWLPPYYPDSLAWPPARIDAWPGPPAMVAVHVRGRSDRRERLVIVQSLGGLAAAPSILLAPAEVLTTTEVTLGTRPAVLTRVVAPDGEVVHDVSWDHGPRRLTLRFHGPVEQLLLIAGSLERTLP
jgi:hypothetical protein